MRAVVLLVVVLLCRTALPFAFQLATAGFGQLGGCVGVGLVIVEVPLGTAESRRQYLWGHARPAGRWVRVESPLAVGQLVVPREQAGVDLLGRQVGRIAVVEVD